MENARVHDEDLRLGDAFGKALLACQHAGGTPGVAYELVERSDGFIGVADAAKYFSTESDSALDLASGRVLDIGAGAGRASVLLQAGGQDVLGLDISPGATEVCRDRGVRATFTGDTTTNPLHLDYHERNRRSGRLPGQLRLRVRHERMVTPWWDYLLCTPKELEEVIAPTAWIVAGVQPRPRPSTQWVATLLLGDPR